MSRLFARLCLAFLLCFAVSADAQSNRWLSAGSFHNWYSEVGSEREIGFRSSGADFQYGWRWPAIHRDRDLGPATDMQVAKGLWIGATNVTADGVTYPARVVHVGPRVDGSGEFFPVRFELISRRDPTVVTVDGGRFAPEAEMVVDAVDPTLEADYVLVNEVNTLLGLTMERRILQFSQDYHDNYHVIEYTFTNTGNTDGDPEIEQPDQTLEGVVVFLQNRLSVVRETRFVIGDNPTGWGKHTMNDARGDGVLPDAPGQEFRAQFSWHGHFPAFGLYDNIGGPILPARVPATFVAPSDTSGRLAASAFAGTVTLFAEGTPESGIDDARQPATTTWFSSDESYTINNSAFDAARMQVEYDLMASGRKSPRHANAVEPTGLPGFLNPTGDPALGTPGGMSYANGYGPYTLAPGESVRFVIAEGAAGLSREATIDIGRAWKQAGADPTALFTYEVGGQSFTKTKNQWVFTSRDSLFQTFRRAIANFESGYDLPRSPAPPATFAVTSGTDAGMDDRILLEWTALAGEPEPDAWRIYRSRVRYDSTATLIHEAASSDRRFEDRTAEPGVEHFYYIQAVDRDGSDGSVRTPSGELTSNRYLAQTYEGALRLRGVAIEDDGTLPETLALEAAYPNPFARSTTVRFALPGAADVSVTVYNVLGTEVVRLAVAQPYAAGRHEVTWDAGALASGVYVVELRADGKRASQRVLLAR
ncbi:MAG: T9SS type A sorting domain-containing protein [Bacteroidota bacterium]